MRLTYTAALLAATALAATPADIAGTWKVRSTWPDGPGLKPVGSIILDLKVNGNTVTGLAHIGSWPGDAPIAEGKLDDNRITFDATGHLTSTTGIPTCHFEAIVVGEEMVLTMTMTRNPAAAPGSVFKFKGKKQADLDRPAPSSCTGLSFVAEAFGQKNSVIVEVEFQLGQMAHFSEKPTYQDLRAKWIVDQGRPR